VPGLSLGLSLDLSLGLGLGLSLIGLDSQTVKLIVSHSTCLVTRPNEAVCTYRLCVFYLVCFVAGNDSDQTTTKHISATSLLFSKQSNATKP